MWVYTLFQYEARPITSSVPNSACGIGVNRIAGPTQPTDDNISTDVQLKLATFPGGSGILVAVKDGMVTLPGSLPTKKQRTQAEKLAKQVHGVKAVVNNITVAKP